MLLSFSIPEMRPMIEAGIRQHDGEDIGDFRVKRQTIRRIRSDRSPWRRLVPGRTLHLWWKSRTPERRFLGEVTCSLAQRLAIEPGTVTDRWVFLIEDEGRGWRPLSASECRELADLDGFNHPDELVAFLKPGAVANWRGVVIRW